MSLGRKCTIICIILVLIIGLTLGIPAGLVDDAVIDSSTNNQNQQVTLPPDFIVEDNGEQEQEVVKPPTFTNGFQAIDYALNIMENGKGFSSYFTQSITTLGKTQEVKTKRYRSGDVNLAEEWYYIDFFVGKNEYKCFYSDNTDMKIKRVTNKNNYNSLDLTFKSCAPDELEEFPVSDWTGKKNRTKLNSFFLTVNSSTARILYFDKTSDEENYIIKCQYKTDKIDKTYLQTMQDNGATNVSFSNFTLIFHIDKSTGYLYKIEKYETMKATYAGFENIECENKSVEIFSGMNTDFSQKIKEEYDKNFIY